eukprot:tig00000093_g3458.t1
MPPHEPVSGPYSDHHLLDHDSAAPLAIDAKRPSSGLRRKSDPGLTTVDSTGLAFLRAAASKLLARAGDAGTIPRTALVRAAREAAEFASAEVPGRAAAAAKSVLLSFAEEAASGAGGGEGGPGVDARRFLAHAACLVYRDRSTTPPPRAAFVEWLFALYDAAGEGRIRRTDADEIARGPRKQAAGHYSGDGTVVLAQVQRLVDSNVAWARLEDAGAHGPGPARSRGGPAPAPPAAARGTPPLAWRRRGGGGGGGGAGGRGGSAGGCAARRGLLPGRRQAAAAPAQRLRDALAAGGGGGGAGDALWARRVEGREAGAAGRRGGRLLSATRLAAALERLCAARAHRPSSGAEGAAPEGEPGEGPLLEWAEDAEGLEEDLEELELAETGPARPAVGAAARVGAGPSAERTPAPSPPPPAAAATAPASVSEFKLEIEIPGSPLSAGLPSSPAGPFAAGPGRFLSLSPGGPTPGGPSRRPRPSRPSSDAPRRGSPPAGPCGPSRAHVPAGQPARPRPLAAPAGLSGARTPPCAPLAPGAISPAARPSDPRLWRMTPGSSVHGASSIWAGGSHHGPLQSVEPAPAPGPAPDAPAPLLRLRSPRASAAPRRRPPPPRPGPAPGQKPAGGLALASLPHRRLAAAAGPRGPSPRYPTGPAARARVDGI